MCRPRERARDADRDNIYRATVEVSDGTDAGALAVTVRVTDGDQAGAVTLPSWDPRVGTTLVDPDWVFMPPSWS